MPFALYWSIESMKRVVFASGSKPAGRVAGFSSSNVELTILAFISLPSAPGARPA